MGCFAEIPHCHKWVAWQYRAASTTNREDPAVKRIVIAMLCLFVSFGALADDQSHDFTDLQGTQRTESWWSSFAECVGRAKSLAPYAAVVAHATPEAIEERATMFWVLAVSRLARDRAISQEEAAGIATESAQLGYQSQQDANLVYTAASKMDWEFDRQVGQGENHLQTYAAAFPEDFQGQQ